MTDWAVWPIFIVELFAFLLVFFKTDRRFLGLRMHTWILILLVGVNIGIALSLYHDSTDALNLHF